MRRYPLFCALENKKYDAAKLLIEHGADVNATVYNNPLVCYGDIGADGVKLLIEYGADINSAIYQCNNYIPIICMFVTDVDMVDWLISKGANITSIRNSLLTPLQMMFRCYSIISTDIIETVALLLKHGVPLNNMPIGEDSPLLAAIDNMISSRCIELLLDAGANVDHKGRDGWRPLIKATYYGCMNTTKLLIERGANVNVKRPNGLSPLFNACKQGHLEIVKMLIERGANMHVKYCSKHTPLTIAQYHKHKEVVDYLTAYEQAKKT